MKNAVFTWGANVTPNDSTPDEAPKCPRRKGSEDHLSFPSSCTRATSPDICLQTNAVWTTSEAAKSAVKRPTRKRSSDCLEVASNFSTQQGAPHDTPTTIQNSLWGTYARTSKRLSRDCLRRSTTEVRLASTSLASRKNAVWNLPELSLQEDLGQVLMQHGSWQ